MILALIIFITLLVAGFIMQELSWGQIGLFLSVATALLLVFYVCLIPLVAYTAVLGVMDAILVLMIFNGDIAIR